MLVILRAIGSSTYYINTLDCSTQPMSCCICMGSDNLMKVKCCNQQFHVDCLNQWLQQKKFTCPVCRNVKDFVGSLPCMRQAVTDGLEHMSRQGFHMYIQRSNIISGVIVIRSYPDVWDRLLRSNSHKGFFFDFRGSKVWIRVEYCPRTPVDTRYQLTFIE